MFLIVQPELVERVVFEAVRGDPVASRTYHREFARCHDEAEGERRDEAFRQLHERWFEQLGFRRRVVEIIDEFAFVAREVSRVALAPAGGRGGRTAELYGAPGRYSVILTVAAATLLDAGAFSYWARHELMHVEDMLDPAFDYDLAAKPSGANAASKNLSRDRYALLWAISVDARMAAMTPSVEAVKIQRRGEFSRAWGITDSHDAEQAVNSLWTQFDRARPTHLELLDRTQTRWAGSGWVHGPSEPQGSPLPGDACPACKFKTFDWSPPALIGQIQEIVRKQLSNWRPQDGLCGRCGEVYLTLSLENVPACG